MPSEDFKLTLLPPVLFAIEQAVGRDVALRFADRCGGRRISVPQSHKIEEGHWIAEMFGVEVGRKIATALGADHILGVKSIDVPMALTERRMLNTLRAYLVGHTSSEIAQLVGIHRGTVMLYLRKMRERGILPADPLDHLSDNVKPEAIARLNERQSPSEIAFALGVPAAALYALRRRMNDGSL